MPDLSSMSLPANILLFLMAATVIALAGSKLATFADRLADRTGLGEAITGTVFLGMATSLAGISASLTAALEGRPALALGNAIGGIALQTTFLAVADLTYTKANLEHAAASVTNMIQATTLIALLTLVLLGFSGPEATIGHIHPITFILISAWAGGFWLAYRSRSEPMWSPRRTADTVVDLPDDGNRKAHLGPLLAGFALTALTVAVAGAIVAHTTGNMAEQTGLNEALAGAIFSAVATSLPELVTTVAAVRRKALTLAVGGIVGGNAFDVLFICAADLAYLPGSIYHSVGVGMQEHFLTALTILLNVVLLLGLLYRQRAGPANIGFESILILLLYLGGLLTLAFAM